MGARAYSIVLWWAKWGLKPTKMAWCDTPTSAPELLSSDPTTTHTFLIDCSISDTMVPSMVYSWYIYRHSCVLRQSSSPSSKCRHVLNLNITSNFAAHFGFDAVCDVFFKQMVCHSKIWREHNFIDAKMGLLRILRQIHNCYGGCRLMLYL